MDATHRGEVARRDLPEFGGEVADVGFPEFIGCGSNVCWLDRPPQGKSNGKGVCECFGDLLPIKRMMIMKYIRRDKAEIDRLRAEVERLRGTIATGRAFAVGHLRVVWRSEGKWGVEDPMRHLRNRVLNRDGRWEWDQESKVTLFTLEEALDAACALVEREAKECKACCGSGVRDDGRWGGIADTTPCSECGGSGVVESSGSVEKCECGGKGA